MGTPKICWQGKPESGGCKKKQYIYIDVEKAGDDSRFFQRFNCL